MSPYSVEPFVFLGGETKIVEMQESHGRAWETVGQDFGAAHCDPKGVLEGVREHLGAVLRWSGAVLERC